MGSAKDVTLLARLARHWPPPVLHAIQVGTLGSVQLIVYANASLAIVMQVVFVNSARLVTAKIVQVVLQLAIPVLLPESLTRSPRSVSVLLPTPRIL